RSPFDFLAAIRHLDPKLAEADLCPALESALKQMVFPQVVRWSLIDQRRITMVPRGHWLLIEDATPFRAALEVTGGMSEDGGQRTEGGIVRRMESVAMGDLHVACFAADGVVGDAKLTLERYAEDEQQVEAVVG